MSTPSSGLLFETAPEERDGQEKKKGRKRAAKAAEPVFAPVVSQPADAVYGFMAPIDGHYECDKCGTSLLDLVEVRKVDGQTKWLITCGWWCMHKWLVDPVPGLLDEVDKQESEKDSFRVRGGRFDGKTFDEIDAAGHRWYIEQLVGEGKREFLAAAAAKWLSEKRG